MSLVYGRRLILPPQMLVLRIRDTDASESDDSAAVSVTVALTTIVVDSSAGDSCFQESPHPDTAQ